MSLEAAIKKLTEAVEANTAALQGQPQPTATKPPKPAAAPKSGRASSDTATKTEPEPEAKGELDYEKDVKPLVLKASGQSREETIKILAKVQPGAATAKQVDAKNYPALIEALTKFLESK